MLIRSYSSPCWDNFLSILAPSRRDSRQVCGLTPTSRPLAAGLDPAAINSTPVILSEVPWPDPAGLNHQPASPALGNCGPDSFPHLLLTSPHSSLSLSHDHSVSSSSTLANAVTLSSLSLLSSALHEREITLWHFAKQRLWSTLVSLCVPDKASACLTLLLFSLFSQPSLSLTHSLSPLSLSFSQHPSTL